MLFAALRDKRLEIARSQNVPAYMVFTDRTLVELARERPQSVSELARIPGIGAMKLEKYGRTFLAVIAGEDPATAV